MSSVSELRDNIKHNKNILEYNSEEFEYASRPLGMATIAYDSEYSYSYGDSFSESDSECFSEETILLKSEPIEEHSSYEYSESESSDKPTELSGASLTEPRVKSEALLTEPKTQETKPIPRWREKVTCKICGGVYSRSGATSHRGTKKHKLYEKANSKFLQFMLRD